MYAYQLPQPDPKQTRRKRRVPRSNSRKRHDPYREIAVETTIKLTVNVLLSVVAIVALVKLMPYRLNQESKLQELDVAVKTTGSRVQRIQSSFNQYFDPSQVLPLMQQTTNRIDPSKRRIILQQPPQAQSSGSESVGR